MQVVKQIISMLGRGIKVYYVTGNHDDKLRRFENFSLGDFHIVNKLVLEHDNGDKSWIFHGDMFDITKQYSKWLTRLGAIGYGILTRINALANWSSKKMGKEKISLSKKIKNSPEYAAKYISKFENTAAEIAGKKGYRFVMCGHLHQPEKRSIVTRHGDVTYLNSGDWVENLTALECVDNEWDIYHYQQDELVNEMTDSFYLDEATYLHTAELFKMMMQDFEVLT